MMRSESTSAFGQPSETKLTFGATLVSASVSGFSVVVSTMRRSRFLGSMRPLAGGECGADRPERFAAAPGDRGLHVRRLAECAHLALPLDGRAGHMGIDAELAQGVGDLLHLGGAAGAVIGHALEVVGDDLRPIEAREAL